MKRYAFLLLVPLACGANNDVRVESQPLARLMGMALGDGKALSIVESLTDRVGSRPSGSPGAARAVQWAVDEMKALGLKNVHTEKVMVPHWIRGEATADITAPNPQKLALVALGPSVATPPEGLTAEVVEVHSFDELKSLGELAKGKIVLFHHVMHRSSTDFREYGEAQSFRTHGPAAAGRAGAVAALVRSAGTGAFRLPHTGATHYENGTPKIPAAALAAEDADLIHRLLSAGQRVIVHLTITAHDGARVESANVVGEVPGREKPQEVVLLAAHLDSWDLATGAIDDGAGVAIVLDAARTIAAGRAPRRTVRVVLFMNEEMGLDGGHEYAQRHAGELSKIVAAMESDSGAGRPLGWGAIGGPSATAILKRLAQPLQTIGAATVMDAEEAGADISPMQGRVPMVGFGQDLEQYFDWHHTAADTFDKIDPLSLSMNVAAVAVMAYQLAEISDVLPMSPATKGRW